MNNMKYPENCIVNKGLFPETLGDLDERFSLVSLDCDLYSPIYAGLEYFYPRLNEGGYIIIHDYNSVDFFGVREAIKNYESKFGVLCKVPIPDQGGTIVITKPQNK